MNLSSPEETVRKYCNISCKNVPLELLDKSAARAHFRKFGQIVRIHLRPKSRTCQIEYINQECAQLASFEANEYNGETFSIVWGAEPFAKKKQARKDPDPEWLPDDPDLKAELEAMGGLPKYAQKKALRRSEGVAAIINISPKKVKRKWQSELQPKTKRTSTSLGKDAKKPQKKLTTEQIDLLKLIKTPAFTTEERYKVLDARDKLIRLHTKKQSDLSKAKVTIGTCPDMCPEKERLMRVVQHQVAVYEQDPNYKGMNPNLAVKQYSRSSADQEVPLPHELRPVKVLQLTMNYLLHRIMDLCDLSDVNIGEWYHFLWDRTRGIRKDITQQELCCLGSVELVEQCARFHIHCSARLVNEEPSVFDQKINTENLTKCLQSLKYMYHDLNLKGIRCPHEPEFRAYIILLNLNDGNFMWEVQQLSPEIQKSSEVKFAIQVYSAIDKNNYVRFFKLVKNTTYLNACILLRYFVQVRLKALRTILKSYSLRAPYTQFPLQELVKVLAFEDIFSTIEFLEYYGLKFNDEKTNVVLDRRLFYSPEIPFALDRAINVVESKRQQSVGEIVFGGPLPKQTFLHHIPQNSFNEEGLIESNDLLEKFKETETENEEKAKITVKETKKRSPYVFENVQETDSNSNIFGSFAPSESSNVLGAKVVDMDSTDGSLKTSDETEKKQEATWPTPFIMKTSTESVFGQPSDAVSSRKSIFGSPVKKVEPFSFKSQFDRGFGATTQSNTFQNAPPAFSSTSGGFKFDLKIPQKKKETPTITLPLEDRPLEMLEAQRLHLQQQLEEEKLMDIQRREAEEAMKIEKENQRLLEIKRQQQKELEDRKREEQRRLELERVAYMQRRKAEEDKKLAELERLKEENKRREKQQKLAEMRRIERAEMEEIATAVSLLMDDLVVKVEENLKQEKLQNISEKIKNWKLLSFLRKWRSKIETKKRKRKIVETSPVWISTRSADQEAIQLFTDMQDLTLNNMKRYKSGKATTLVLPKKRSIKKIDFHKLSETLLKNYANKDTKPHAEIFWKITVSLPDFRELKYGLFTIEEIFKEYFNWTEDKYGNTCLIKQTKLLGSRVTCGVERRQGIRSFENNNNGIFFVANDINTQLIQRIKESVKNFRKNVVIPISVHVFQDPSEEEAENLMTILNEEEHISEYIITKESLQPSVLTRLLEESVSFLAKSAKIPPSLALNTLDNFLRDNLHSDLWNYVTSYGKWNNLYKKCLQRPNVVISIFNEALDRIKEIVNSDNIKEFPDFPEEFQDYVNNKIPDILPCDYRYFPKFWNKEEYLFLISSVIESFKLPEYKGIWPPSSELALEKDMFNYCVLSFPENNKIFYKIMSVILEHFDPEENFERIRKVSWVNIIEVISLEKIEKADFSLRNTEFYSKSIFNQLVVVYNPEDVFRFSREPWFYITNPLVSTEMKRIRKKMQEDKVKKNMEHKEKKKEQLFLVEEDHVEIDLDKTLESILQKSVDQDDLKRKKFSLRGLEFLMDDLEESMNIQKKISETFQQTVQSVLLDV